MDDSKFNIAVAYQQYMKLFNMIINWCVTDIDDSNTTIPNKLDKKELHILLSKTYDYLNSPFFDENILIDRELHEKTTQELVYLYERLFGNNMVFYDYPKTFYFDISIATGILRDMCWSVLECILKLLISKEMIINRYENNQSQDITIKEATCLYNKLKDMKKSENFGLMFITKQNHLYNFDTLLEISKRCNAAPEYILLGYLYNYDISDDYHDELKMDTEEAEYLKNNGVYCEEQKNNCRKRKN